MLTACSLAKLSSERLQQAAKGNRYRDPQPNISWTDVGFPFVCYEYVLLLLVNKEADLLYDRAEYSQTGREIYIERE